MAPNANTHLLTARDYCRLAPWEYSGGAVLQLDLGDGATHTPRPGSRAQRAGASRPAREHAQAMSCLRSRSDDDELRAVIELSVLRAYSSFGVRPPNAVCNAAASSASPSSLSTGANVLTSALAWRTLPTHSRQHELQLPPTHMPTVRGMAGPSSRSGSSSPSVSPRRALARGPHRPHRGPSGPHLDYRTEGQYLPPSRGHSPGYS